ncbi:hypothetical protein OSB04_030031 [Centaurea solstitialis]|uniref:Uncharacterized protein n=1 Tax=Centaurea solstitialis TaxID=347529 RepID=A0AA38S7N6_9ASTR|nr:hypothetical protein OSB04_030031 [Centaurea solstitialis]
MLQAGGRMQLFLRGLIQVEGGACCTLIFEVNESKSVGRILPGKSVTGNLSWWSEGKDSHLRWASRQVKDWDRGLTETMSSSSQGPVMTGLAKDRHLGCQKNGEDFNLRFELRQQGAGDFVEYYCVEVNDVLWSSMVVLKQETITQPAEMEIDSKVHLDFGQTTSLAIFTEI